MPSPDPRPTSTGTGTGAVIVLSLLTGLIVGSVAGQPTLGFLIGLGVGVAIALLIWWRERS